MIDLVPFRNHTYISFKIIILYYIAMTSVVFDRITCKTREIAQLYAFIIVDVHMSRLLRMIKFDLIINYFIL